jgi:hypothetical protein
MYLFSLPFNHPFNYHTEKHNLKPSWCLLSTTHYFNHIIKVSVKDVEKLEPLCTNGNVNGAAIWKGGSSKIR